MSRHDASAALLGGEPTNTDRAFWGQRAIEEFAKVVGQTGEPVRDNLTDLLADLMHFCRKKRLSFDKALETAYGHFAAEVREELEGTK
jgi:hypothetical protein